VLIISPHFPPINAADMHRVRHSLPHFREFGWEPLTLAVDPEYVEGFEDELLLRTVPEDVTVERVSALDFRWTRLFGLGNLALRSLPFLARKGNEILRAGDVDLIYFSTTAFASLSLGPYWKRKFGVPFVVDMQDPWYNDYYETRPKSERPPKYWFSHRLDGMLEPRVMQQVDGLIAVTQAYINDLSDRYPQTRSIPCLELPFAVSPLDTEVAAELASKIDGAHQGRFVGTYTGVCNSAMAPILRCLFRALNKGRRNAPEVFGGVRLRFVGTSYAPSGTAKPSVLPIAKEEGVGDVVTEQTDRVSYFEALRLQQDSSFLLLPGTLDSDYTASKLYPYVLARRPVLGLIHEESSAVRTLSELNIPDVLTFRDEAHLDELSQEVARRWERILRDLPFEPDTNWQSFEKYTAREMTRSQAALFDQVVGETMPEKQTK
jgi:hypothetical protein